MFSFTNGDGTREARAWNEATDEERTAMCRRYEHDANPDGLTQYQADLLASHEGAQQQEHIYYER